MYTYSIHINVKKHKIIIITTTFNIKIIRTAIFERKTPLTWRISKKCVMRNESKNGL